jgi:hypothetical protein
MAAALAVPLAVAGTVAASGPAAAAPAAGGVHAAASAAAGARVPTGLVSAVRASHGSGVQLRPASSLAWSQARELTPPTSADFDEFGYSVVMSENGTTAAVAARNYPFANGSAGAGAVFVYKDVSGTWTRTGTLTGASPGDGFGVSVAISTTGSTIVVGAPYSNDGGNGGGGAFIYSDSSGSWKQTASLPDPDGALNEYMGSAVAISGAGNTVAVLAPDYPDASPITGAVYFYQLGSTGWKRTTKITGVSKAGLPQGTFEDIGLSSAGSALVVSNEGATTTAGASAGSVLVYDRSSTGKWAKKATLTASDAAANEGFGNSVAISASGTTIVVGDENYTNSSRVQKGAAYVFNNSSGSWRQTGELTGTTGSLFGSSVAVTTKGAVILVGAENADSAVGQAFVYGNSSGTWKKTSTLAPRTAVSGAAFGNSVALSGRGAAALIGADVPSGSGAGAAYVFVK